MKKLTCTAMSLARIRELRLSEVTCSSSKWSPLTNTTQLWIQDSIYMIINQAQSLNKYPLLTLQLPTSSPINWHISLSFLKPDFGLLSWLFLQMSLLETRTWIFWQGGLYVRAPLFFTPFYHILYFKQLLLPPMYQLYCTSKKSTYHLGLGFSFAFQTMCEIKRNDKLCTWIRLWIYRNIGLFLLNCECNIEV